MNINNTLLFFKEELKFLHKLYISKKLSPSNIIFGNDGIGKRTFAYHLSLLLCSSKNEQENYLNNFTLKNDILIQKIEEDAVEYVKILKKKNKEKNISIEAVRKIINFCKYQSFNEKAKFIIINNTEDLSISASNAILKILESPPKNTYFFLLNNSNTKILETIVSRCFKVRLRTNLLNSKKILENLIKKNNIEFVNYNIFSKYDSHGLALKKILYFNKNFKDDKGINEIVQFCINDFKKNGNSEAFDFLLSFVQNYYYNIFLDENKFFNNNKIYKDLLLNIKDCISYNSDFSNLNFILKKI